MTPSMFPVLILATVSITAVAHGSVVCDADIDDSGLVDGSDLAALLGQWGGSRTADLNQDGAVDGNDLSILLGHWGAICDRPGAPRVTFTRVAHSFEPAHGIDVPGVVYTFMSLPKIDAEGNVVFRSYLEAPGLVWPYNLAIFYGQPGRVTKLLRAGDSAPGFPEGVTYSKLSYTDPALSETGLMCYSAHVQGPGITPDDNDMVIFFGDPRIPGDIRPILQSGDQAPGLAPGITVRYDWPGTFFFGQLSDNGTMLLAARLAGPGVTAANDYAMWTGTPGDFHLVYRTGMPAPGTTPGVTFQWPDFVTFNDDGMITFRSTVIGPGIVDGVSYNGRWVASPEGIQVVSWSGHPAPGLPAGTTIASMQGGLTSTNGAGDVYAATKITGPDVTPENDVVLHVGQPGKMHLVARTGQLVPEAGPHTSIHAIMGNAYLNDTTGLFYRVQYRGPTIDSTNSYANYFATEKGSTLCMRDGDPAPHFPAGTIFSNVGAMTSYCAMNDAGDLVTLTEISGPTIAADQRVSLWMRLVDTGEWIPLVRGGDIIDGVTVSIPDFATDPDYWTLTGGADGLAQSFNDSRQLVVGLSYSGAPWGAEVMYVVRVERE